MVTVLIYRKRGRTFFKILRGRMFCSRMNQELPRSAQHNCNGIEKLANGVHKVHKSVLGYDSCDFVR